MLFSSSQSQYKKEGVHSFDVAATYALLAGAIILDFVSLIIKLIFSDWTVALVEHSSVYLLRPLLTYLNVTSGILAIKRIISFRKRWCQHLYNYNLIAYSLNRPYAFVVVDKIAEFFALKEYPVRFWYKTQEKLDDSIKVFIFDNLQEKAYTAKETKVATGYILPEANARWSIMIVLSQLNTASVKMSSMTRVS